MGVNGLITRQRKNVDIRSNEYESHRVHNRNSRSIQRKFAEIFGLILDRLLMYYE